MDREIRWFNMTVSEQLANVGSEVGRAIRWKNKNNEARKMDFYNKAIELLNLSEKDPKNKHRISELEECKNELEDYIVGDNLWGSTDDNIMKYYDSFIRF